MTCRNLLLCLFVATACALAGRALAQDAANAPLTAAQEQALKPGDTFQECSHCPLMIVLPAGSFTMGSPASEPGRDANEGPQHRVTMARPFAVGRFELTFDEWDACIFCGKLSDQGWGRGRRPAIWVSWDQATAFVGWFAGLTGKPYRLLSEAEYEYAARGGTTTAYPWGSPIGKNNANCDGCGSSWDGRQTAPVGSFPPNKFALYDMVGNVSEWTQDCYHDSYSGAPADGSAWTGGDCSNGRVLRGGAFNFPPRDIRSGARGGSPVAAGPGAVSATAYRSAIVGFRVGRTLVSP